MRDPYKILGVAFDADSDEIKKAYRQLSRRYHPDANINNPNKDFAEAKFKEIQDAYKQIIDMRENGESSYGGFNSGWGSRNHYNNDIESMRLKSAEVYINNGRFKEALNVLNEMSVKNGMWYYYRAAANQGMGNHIMALDDAKTALNLEPDNIIFQQFYDRLRSAQQWYQNQSSGYGFSNISMGDCCMKLLLFNCICGCCL